MSDNLMTMEVNDAPVNDAPATEPTVEPTATDWTANVPDKFKGENGVNHEAIFKSYTELEKQFSGRETVPEDYEFALPEDVEFTDEEKAEFDQFKTAFKEAGLTQTQFTAVMEQMMPTLSSAVEELKAEFGHIKDVDTVKQELAAEWGDKFGQKISAIQSIAKSYNKSGADINSYGFNDPNVLKLLSDLSGQFKEASPMRGQEVTDSLAQIRANPAYWDTRHPEYAGLQRRALELTELKAS